MFSKKTLITFAILAFAAYEYLNEMETSHPPGILVAEAPVQVNYPASSPRVPVDGAAVQALASYDIRARVLSIHHYWFDKLSRLAPYDFAVGWGVMSDTGLLEQLNISQNQRFYFYSWDHAIPVDPQQIVKSSANMHLLPANSKIKKLLSRVHVGDIIHLKGQLIRIDYNDGSRAISSLVRDDSGPGSCEIMWVTEVL